jgi:hypothetical protein
VLWMVVAFLAALCVASITLGIRGANERGTDTALAVTARLSFLLFWLSYVGSGMTALFGRTFQPLKARAREFGLAFASAHLVHVGLVVWLCGIGHPPGASVFVFFGIALVWTYLLALFSIGHLRNALNPLGWWLLSNVGMNYIAYAFAVDFIKYPFDPGVKNLVGYLPFAILAVVGPIVRLSPFVLRVAHRPIDPSYRAR